MSHRTLGAAVTRNRALLWTAPFIAMACAQAQDLEGDVKAPWLNPDGGTGAQTGSGARTGSGASTGTGGSGNPGGSPNGGAGGLGASGGALGSSGGSMGVGGGLSNSGGTGGATHTGGATSAGGNATGGANNTGGANDTGGAQSTGGTQHTGGTRNTGGSLGTGGTTPTGGAQNTGGTAGCTSTQDTDGDGMTDCAEQGDGDAWTDPAVFNGMHVRLANQCDSTGNCSRNDTLTEVDSCMQNVLQEKNQYSGWDWDNPPDNVCDSDYHFLPNWSPCRTEWAADWRGCIHFPTNGPHCFRITGGTNQGCAALYFDGNTGNADAQTGTAVKCFTRNAGNYPIRWHYTMDAASGSSMHVQYCDAAGGSTCTPSTAIPAKMLRTSCQ